jgi:hypothetical protein
MFEKYYKRLRFSQKIGDRSLIACMKIIESNRSYVLSCMKEEKVFCHQGCNLCCHSLTLMVDTLDSYILSRVFETIPYDELFPYYKKCLENRINARDYIEFLPDDDNCNYPLEAYNKFGFNVQTCPFVNEQNGCLIHEFSPQICFTYFSSVPCKISLNPDISEGQRTMHNAFKDRAENVISMGLDNDNKNYRFDDYIFENYNKFSNLEKNIKQDPTLEYFLSHKLRFEILTIVSIALEKSNAEKFKCDTKELNADLLAYIDGEIKYL